MGKRRLSKGDAGYPDRASEVNDLSSGGQRHLCGAEEESIVPVRPDDQHSLLPLPPGPSPHPGPGGRRRQTSSSDRGRGGGSRSQE